MEHLIAKSTIHLFQKESIIDSTLLSVCAISSKTIQKGSDFKIVDSFESGKGVHGSANFIQYFRI